MKHSCTKTDKIRILENYLVLKRKRTEKEERTQDRTGQKAAVKKSTSTLTWVRTPLFCYPQCLCTWQRTSPLPSDTWCRTPHSHSPEPRGLFYVDRTLYCLVWRAARHWRCPKREKERVIQFSKLARSERSLDASTMYSLTSGHLLYTYKVCFPRKLYFAWGNVRMQRVSCSI